MMVIYCKSYDDIVRFTVYLTIMSFDLRKYRGWLRQLVAWVAQQQEEELNDRLDIVEDLPAFGHRQFLPVPFIVLRVFVEGSACPAGFVRGLCPDRSIRSY
jgi:hypothetical protein